MMYRKLRLLFALLFLLAISSQITFAQVGVLSKDGLAQVQGGYTHVIMAGYYTDDAFYDVFKKYWMLSKGVDVKRDDELDGHMITGDSYFTFGLDSRTYSNGATVSDLFLGLWTPKERAVENEKKFSVRSLNLLGKITLTQNDRMIISGPLADGASSTGNFTPGILKNYLQRLSDYIKEGKKLDPWNAVTDKEQLKLLQTQTLYCTPDLFYQHGGNGDKTKFIKSTFEDYKYTYQVVSPAELSAKILADTELFYYVIYLHNYVAGKIVAVINSRTGEVVYSRRKVSFSFEVKSHDLKEISNEVK